jgi:hypothetical protein
MQRLPAWVPAFAGMSGINWADRETQRRSIDIGRPSRGRMVMRLWMATR